jgi:hypothetical protein
VNWGDIPTDTVEADGKKKRKLTKRASISRRRSRTFPTGIGRPFLQGRVSEEGGGGFDSTTDDIIVSDDADDHVEGGLLFNNVW